MAEIRYVDWDGLVYYDGKSKQYITDLLENCMKFGGSISAADLPAPSYQNLNTVYQVTDDFTSTDYFHLKGYNYDAGTIVQVTELDGIYLYSILVDVKASAPVYPDGEVDLSEIEDRLDTVESTIDTQKQDIASNVAAIEAVEASVEDVQTSLSETNERIATLDAEFAEDVSQLTQAVAEAQANAEANSTAIAAVDTKFASYYTKEETDTAILTAIASIPEVDLNDYVTESELEAKGYLTEHQSLEGLASETYVDEAVAGIVIPEIPTVVSAFTNDAGYLTSIPDEYITESELEAKGYLTEHQDLSEYAKKSELNGLATESFVLNKIAEAELNDKEVDLSGYATKDDIKGLASEQFVTDAISGIDIPEVPTNVGAFTNDKNYTTLEEVAAVGYITTVPSDDTKLDKDTYEADKATFALKTDIPSVEGLASKSYVDEAVKNVSVDLTGYATETFVTDEIAKIEVPSIDGLATEEFVTSAVASVSVPTKTSELTNDSGFITLEDVPETNLDAYATKDFVTEEINKIDIPDVSGFITEVPAEYVTETELGTALEGYVTTSVYSHDMDEKSNVGHNHKLEDIVDYKAPDLTPYAKTADVETALGEKADSATLESAVTTLTASVATKANDVLFTEDYKVTKAVGGFVGDGTESLKNMTLRDILMKLLGATLQVVYETVADQIIAEEPHTYVLDESGNLVESPYAYRSMTEEEASAPSDQSYFYQITDDEGNVIESGFQQDTPSQEEAWLTVAVPDYVTNFHVEQYNPVKTDWEKVIWVLEANPEQTVDGYVIYSVPEAYEVASGITIRIVIE